jgi:pterin-4a-carbinolamine dehydratase
MNWKQESNKLIKTFKFASQEKLALFFLEVARISDVLDHHADVKIYNCSEIELTIFTHTSHSLTHKDFELAEKINLCYSC